VAKPFFTLWAGAEYGRESTLPFYILAAGWMLNIIAYVPYMLLMAYGRSDMVARIHLSELLPYLVGVALLTYYFGVIGAAIAWSLRTLVDTLLFVLIARRLAGFSASPFPTHKGSLALALACLIIPIGLVFSGASLAVIASATLIALTSYGAIVWTRVLACEERQWLQAMLRWRGLTRAKP
jgi:O-antigen/teichoic acid export membrane protein